VLSAVTWSCSNAAAIQPNVAPPLIDVVVNANSLGTYIDTVVVHDPTGEPPSFDVAPQNTAADSVTVKSTAEPEAAAEPAAESQPAEEEPT